jgi:hypothetical protein
MNDKPSMFGPVAPQPSDNLHPAILAAAVAEDFTAKIMIERNKIECLARQFRDTVVGSLDSSYVIVFRNQALVEFVGSAPVVIKEENSLYRVHVLIVRRSRLSLQTY